MELAVVRFPRFDSCRQSLKVVLFTTRKDLSHDVVVVQNRVVRHYGSNLMMSEPAVNL